MNAGLFGRRNGNESAVWSSGARLTGPTVTAVRRERDPALSRYRNVGGGGVAARILRTVIITVRFPEGRPGGILSRRVRVAAGAEKKRAKTTFIYTRDHHE